MTTTIKANDMTKIRSKLQKLLALAGSDNEAEASLAMQKAEELMNKYGLRTIDVALDGSGAHVGNEEVEGTTKTVQAWEQHLAHYIARAFDGRVVIRRGYGPKWAASFVAGRSDLEIILDLFQRLRATVLRMSKNYVKNSPEVALGLVSTKSAHHAYRVGMVSTIGRRLQEVKKNTTPQHPVGTTGKDLMVVKDKAVEQRMHKLFPNLTALKSRVNIRSSNAYNQGREDGHKVNLNRSVRGNSRPRAIA